MTEQRRDAHRGSAGLSQTWLGVIARARLRARYMALCRRLLTVGMRPPVLTEAAAKAAPSAAGVPSYRTRTDGMPPSMVRRRTAPAPAPRTHLRTGPPPTSPFTRRSVSVRESTDETQSQFYTKTAAGADGRVVSESDGGPGGNSKELRRLAEQIRTRGGRRASVTRRYSMDIARELQVMEDA